MKHGVVNSGADVFSSSVRCGHTAAITSLMTSIDVTFSSAMPDANYEIALFLSGVSAAFTISGKLTTGFTIGFVAGIIGSITYIALPTV